MRVMQPNLLSGKYKFIKNYDFPTYRQDVAFVNFKTNDVVYVDYIYPKPSYNSLVGNFTEPAHFLYKSDLNNLSIKIPSDYIVKVDDNSKLSKISNLTLEQSQNDAIKKANADAPALPTKSGNAFFSKLAGAYNKNLIVAVVLVAGYFAYKKFKK